MTPVPDPSGSLPSAGGVSHLAETIRAQHGDTQAIVNQLYRTAPVIEEDVTPSVPPPATGDQIGQYALRDPLGVGGSCYVFRAWDGENRRPVAVKILNWATVY